MNPFRSRKARRQQFQDALELHERRLVRYATHLVGDLDQARDVVQDTFLELWRLNGVLSPEHLVRWLFKVCRHRAIDLLRKEQRTMNLDMDTAAALPADVPGPDQQLADKERCHGVFAALERLPLPQREVIQLKFQEDLSYREISAITGHSESNVGYLIHQGIRQLRQTLGADRA